MSSDEESREEERSWTDNWGGGGRIKMKLKLRTTTGEEGGGGAHRLIYLRGSIVIQQSALLRILSGCIYWNRPIALFVLCLPRLNLTDI